MAIQNFDDESRQLLDERLPRAFDRALLVSKKAETVIYMAIVRSLEMFSDVAIEFESYDPICSFLNKWNEEGYINGALSFEDVGSTKKRLACRFDLYEIRDTFDTLSSDLFGTISDEYGKKLDNSGKVAFSPLEAAELERGFQKVNLRKENK